MAVAPLRVQSAWYVILATGDNRPHTGPSGHFQAFFCLSPSGTGVVNFSPFLLGIFERPAVGCRDADLGPL